MGIVFRSASVLDAPALVSLVEELGYPSSPAAVQARLVRLLSEPDQAVFVAVEGSDAGVVVGWVHVQEFLSLASDAAALVTGLVVASWARGRGIGRGLLGEAEGWSRARGLTTLRLRSRVTRSAAHAFYLHLGYTITKQQLQFRKVL